jgi:putative hemolysin
LETESLTENLFVLSGILINPPDLGSFLGLVVIILLLIISALISGSEVAYFSLRPNEIQTFRENQLKNGRLVLDLLESPERLLATIVIANNLVNVAIVIVSSYWSGRMFDFSDHPLLGFMIQVVVITFVLLLFGEIIPKVYATRYGYRFAGFMAYTLSILLKVFKPLSVLLISSTSLINKRLQKRKNLSVGDLSDALDIAEDQIEEDTRILKGIVRFGNIDVKEIMRSRTDVIAVEYDIKFKKLLSVIVDSGYSRIPVFEEDFDHVKGILFIKDLLPFIHESDDFEWNKLIRKPYFVPESKKIDDLLEEFKTHKNHMAVVIDEYGGTSGIVTLEDILEEIVGEITDEMDDEDIDYKKIDDNQFVFEGKTQLNDFLRIIGEEDMVLDDVRGEADTLAGLILEFIGEIPHPKQEIRIANFLFKIKSADQRRIRQIEVKINRQIKNDQ